MSDNAAYALAHVYTPGGVRVSVPFSPAITAADLDSQLTARGFLHTAPGSDLPPGAKLETVGYVCLTWQHNEDGRPDTPKIYLYHEAEILRYVIGAIYLNNDDDHAQFHAQSGCKVDELPTFDGDQPLDKKSRSAGKYLVACRHFEITKIPRGTGEDGKPRYRYQYANPITLDSTPQPVKMSDMTKSDKESLRNALRAANVAERGSDVLFHLDPTAKTFSALDTTLEDVIQRIPGIAQRIRDTDEAMARANASDQPPPETDDEANAMSEVRF